MAFETQILTFSLNVKLKLSKAIQIGDMTVLINIIQK